MARGPHCDPRQGVAGFCQKPQKRAIFWKSPFSTILIGGFQVVRISPIGLLPENRPPPKPAKNRVFWKNRVFLVQMQSPGCTKGRRSGPRIAVRGYGSNPNFWPFRATTWRHGSLAESTLGGPEMSHPPQILPYKNRWKMPYFQTCQNTPQKGGFRGPNKSKIQRGVFFALFWTFCLGRAPLFQGLHDSRVDSESLKL